MRAQRFADRRLTLPEQNRRSLWMVLVAMLLILASFIGVDLSREHDHIDAEERQQLATQANVIDENLTQRLMSTNAAIDAIRRELPWLLAQENGRSLVNSRLVGFIEVMSGARTLIVMNAEGEAIASNQNVLVGQNFRDGQRFRVIRQGGDPTRLYVSPPFKTPLGTYAISVGKVIVDQTGRFSGVILAILDQEFFKALMNTVRYSADMRTSVAHGDGQLIFSTEDTLDMSAIDLSKHANSFFSRHLKSGQELSVFSGSVASTNDERLVALRTIGPDPIAMSKPLVIAISRALPTIYAQWRQQALIKLGLLGLLALFGALGLFFYLRHQHALLRVVAAKEAEQRQVEVLAGSERFIRTITDAIPGLVAYFDTDLRCQFANKAYLDWYGKSASSIIGNTLIELMGKTLFTVNEAHIRAALAGENQQFERFLTRPDGSVGHVLANYVADFDAAGSTIGFIIVVTDIKAFKVAEAELKLAAKVFECTSEAIMVTDAEGLILSVNPAFTEITGFSAQEAIGKTPRILQSDHHSQEYYAAMWQKIMEAGLWKGEIWNRRKSGEIVLDWQTITKIPGARAGEERYVAVFHDMMESWEKNESIKHLAFHDPLTNLPNRRLLTERIERHIVRTEREPRNLVILFLDLDRFKAVNDLLGHAVGDALLMTVAQKLQSLVRDTDTVARLGGDEFVITLDNPANTVEVERIANRIIAVVNEPVEFQGKFVHVGTSVGIATYPDSGTTAAELIRSADRAMYEAKKAGKNTFCFYVHEQSAAISPVDTGTDQKN